MTGSEFVRGGGHDDDVHEDDVIVGTDDLSATLTLTARSKVSPVNQGQDDQQSKRQRQPTGGF